MRGVRPLALLVLLTMLAAACVSSPRYTSRPGKGARSKTVAPPRSSAAASGRIRPGTVLSGVASFYGSDFHGKQTANGEIFDMYGVSAAHKTLPFNTIARVTNLNNRKQLIVRINDRGPYVKGRMLHLSYGAALKLGFVAEGTTKVRVEIIEVGDNLFMKHLQNPP